MITNKTTVNVDAMQPNVTVEITAVITVHNTVATDTEYAAAVSSASQQLSSELTALVIAHKTV